MDEDIKVTENRVRRLAERRGYRLEKSRRRDAGAVDYNGYVLIRLDNAAPVIGHIPYMYSAALEEVEAYLKIDVDRYYYKKEIDNALMRAEIVLGLLQEDNLGRIEKNDVEKIQQAQSALNEVIDIVKRL